MKWITVLSIFLIGCTQNTEYNVCSRNDHMHDYDMIEFKQEFYRSDLIIKVYSYDSIDSLQSGIGEFLEYDKNRIHQGISVWAYNDNFCEIHVLEPKTSEDVDTWGHELMHCVYGRWHD